MPDKEKKICVRVDLPETLVWEIKKALPEGKPNTENSFRYALEWFLEHKDDDLKRLLGE